jgi:tetratricopeptide (TPR) repeat protein
VSDDPFPDASEVPAGVEAPPDVPVEFILREGEEAARRQLWEAAVAAYKRALKQESRSDIRIKLGRAYEGLSRDKDGQAFLLLAMEQYRQAVKTDPRNAEAYDALLAAGTKARKLDDLTAEHRAWLQKDPTNDVCRAAVKKMETILLMQVNPAAEEKAAGPNPLVKLLLDRILPFAGLGALLGGLALRFKGGSDLAHSGSISLIRTGIFFLVVYLSYKVFFRR